MRFSVYIFRLSVFNLTNLKLYKTLAKKNTFLRVLVHAFNIFILFAAAILEKGLLEPRIASTKTTSLIHFFVALSWMPVF